MNQIKLVALAFCVLFSSNLGIAQESEVIDRLRLKSGGELLGKLIDDSKVIDGKLHVVFKTESGAMLQLEKTAIVSKVFPLDDRAHLKYRETYANANDLKMHWEAVDWCKNQKNEKIFRDEINYHLRQILKLDPNDEKAWRGIKSPVTGKNTYRKRDGAWVNEVERFKQSGYVKSENKWMSEEALRVIEQIEGSDNSGEVNKAMGKWKKLLRNKPALAADALGDLISRETVVPLFNLASGEKKRKDLPAVGLRNLIMEAIATIDSPQALNALVYFAVEDPNLDIRSRASTLLENTGFYPADDVVRTVLRSNYLRAQSNTTIQRAALLLNRVGSLSAILPLIDALETQHTVSTGERPGGLSTSARGGQIEGFKAGSGPATKKVMKKNTQAYQALRSLSGQTQDFGFDKQQWKTWYIRKYTHTDLDVRADE